MARRVDEVEFVDLTLVGVAHGHGGSFDGDAALALEIHRVEKLCACLARRDSLRLLKEAIGKGALAVVNVGDDGEVADIHGNPTV